MLLQQEPPTGCCVYCPSETALGPFTYIISFNPQAAQ